MNKKVTRGAILIAITVVLQLALRELGGLGPVAKIMVGICINACIILTVYYSNFAALIVNAFAAPLIAIMFGALPTPAFLYPVVAANLAYALSFAGFSIKFGSEMGAVFLATLMRSAVFMVVGLGVIMLFQIDKLAPAVLIPFAVIQLATGAFGGLLAIFIHKRIGDLP